MKIALFGYGRMGKEIEKIAIKRGHTVVLKITYGEEKKDLSNVDVALDFTYPSAAFDNVKYCLENNTPIVSGTTGWLEEYEEISEICKLHNGTFLHASNFSLGVHLFFELNKYLAKLMADYSQMYEPNITEIHHVKKMDAPSGTAIALTEPILENFKLNRWYLDILRKEEGLPIIAKRIENTPGTHIVEYESDVDIIEIKHTAKNRKGFALGAIMAAEFIHNKKGIFTMKDVLSL